MGRSSERSKSSASRRVFAAAAAGSEAGTPASLAGAISACGSSSTTSVARTRVSPSTATPRRAHHRQTVANVEGPPTPSALALRLSLLRWGASLGQWVVVDAPAAEVAVRRRRNVRWPRREGCRRLDRRLPGLLPGRRRVKRLLAISTASLVLGPATDAGASHSIMSFVTPQRAAYCKLVVSLEESQPFVPKLSASRRTTASRLRSRQTGDRSTASCAQTSGGIPRTSSVCCASARTGGETLTGSSVPVHLAARFCTAAGVAATASRAGTVPTTDFGSAASGASGSSDVASTWMAQRSLHSLQPFHSRPTLSAFRRGQRRQPFVSQCGSPSSAVRQSKTPTACRAAARI
jgi:hypothetical protein